MISFIGKYLSRNFYNNPVFVVGSGRSGTSVLLQALGKHKQILALPGEAPFYTSVGGDTYLFEFAENSEYYTNSLNVKKTYFYNAFKRIGFESAAGQYYGLTHIINTIIKTRKNLFSIKYFGVKTFPSEKPFKGLNFLFPKAKYIYIARSGIDVVNSMSKYHGFKERNFQTHCEAWTNEAMKYRYLIKADNCIFVRHEDLVENPTTFFEKIFDFMALPLDQKVVEFVTTTVVHPLDKGDRKNTDAKAEFKARTSPYFQWTLEQKELFNAICGDMMVEIGYTIPGELEQS